VNTEDKMNVCRKLAHSFRRHELTDDLIQEGMVAMLESESRGNTHPPTLEWEARKKMRDFISLRQGPLSIPCVPETIRNAAAIRKGSETPVTEHMTSRTYDSLKTALEASTALLEGDEVMYEGNTEEYIWVQQVEDLMREKLSEKDFQIFQMRFGPEEFTQVEVAKALDMSERNVRLREHTIQKKLSRLK
jgi:RNA polymerase sigma factor (sigma-70 family)